MNKDRERIKKLNAALNFLSDWLCERADHLGTEGIYMYVEQSIDVLSRLKGLLLAIQSGAYKEETITNTEYIRQLLSDCDGIDEDNKVEILSAVDAAEKFLNRNKGSEN